MADSRTEAGAALRAHGQTIDALHQKLASLPGADSVKLKMVVEKYKTAHATFEDDALECIVH